MNIHASNLDIEKFRKVYALVTGGATDGERVAAQARARKIAERAGMSLNDAVSQLDSQPKPKPANFFEGFADWMEEKEPGYKAKRAREVVEREQRYASRRAEILKQFGTAKAFLDPTPNERLILKAAEPFIAELGEPYEDACGTWRRPISSFAGVHSHFFNLDDVDPEAIMAIK
ncbi:winged helix-turn-helix domain-containing protein, partial [Brucella abortus]|nr:winged helix-turn-helix domain-containing protein [Brucella abortus]